MANKPTGEIPKTDKRLKSPLDVARTVVDDRTVPDTIDLDPDIANEAEEVIARGMLSQVKHNTLTSALTRSKVEVEEAKRELASVIVPPSQSPVNPLSPLGGGLLSQQMIGAPDRSASIKAILDSFTTDEGRAHFIDTHPEMFSPTPFPQFGGMQQYRPPQQPSVSATSPSPTSPQPPFATDPLAIMQMAGQMVLQGIQMQRDASQQSAPPVVSGTAAPDVLKVAEVFRELNDKNTAALTSIITELRQDREASNKLIAEQSGRIIEMQIGLKDKDIDYLKGRQTQLEEALRTPSPLTVDQLRYHLDQWKANGGIVSIDTPDQERVRAEITREDKKLEFDLESRRRHEELENIREQRRAVSTQAALGLVTSVLEGSVLKKHKLSTDGASVASRM